jgi:hypothetical protein
LQDCYLCRHKPGGDVTVTLVGGLESRAPIPLGTFSRELTSPSATEVRSVARNMSLVGVTRILLLGRKPSDPTFNLSRKLPSHAI